MVYIFLAEGFEEIEALTVVDMLRRAKIGIAMVSITRNNMVTGAHKIKIVTDILFEDSEYGDAEMFILPGGMPGTTNLMQHDGLGKLLVQAGKKGKNLAAICAAPRVLGSKGLLKGKNATCYPGTEDISFGAKYLDADVIADGNVITSRGMGTAIDFSLSLITRLKNKEEAIKVAEAIQYRHYE